MSPGEIVLDTEEVELVNTRTVSLSLVTRLTEPYTVSVTMLVTSLDTLGWRLMSLLEAELSDLLIRDNVGDIGSGSVTDGDMIVSTVLKDPDPGMMVELSLTLRSKSGNKGSSFSKLQNLSCNHLLTTSLQL